MSIDDRYLAEWVEYGMRALADYLQKHARFEAYLASREPTKPRRRRAPRKPRPDARA
jgi:hypothetical protein